MIRLLTYLIRNGIVTRADSFAELPETSNGMPKLSDNPCLGDGCRVCEQVCPTEAIRIEPTVAEGATLSPCVTLDRGACINCSLCVDLCSTHTIVTDRDPRTASKNREELVLRSSEISKASKESSRLVQNPFKKSIACRVVSTGCSACDQEIAAASNPIFDMERFGIHVVASPRFADVLLVTGPVPKSMHEALKRCYGAMSEPKRVIAVGTCACTGGVHRGSYSESNGIGDLLPVDVYIPGCPPHPASIIAGIMLLMDRLPGLHDKKKDK